MLTTHRSPDHITWLSLLLSPHGHCVGVPEADGGATINLLNTHIDYHS